MTGSPTRDSTTGRVSNLNVANALTGLRILLVPVFVFFLMFDSGTNTEFRLLATGVFVLASATDLIDGELARRANLVTDLGKLADPIADKALTGSALICLSLLHELAWWITLVILVREIGLTIFRLAVAKRGVIAAGRGGKVKTIVQMLAIVCYLLPLTGWMVVASQVLMGLAVVLTVGTGLDYLYNAWRRSRKVATA